MTTSSANNSVFRGFFEKQKLTGPNFLDWYRQLRIVLSIEDRLNYLEQPIPPAPVAPEEGQSVSSYALKMKGYIDNLEHLGYPITLGLGVSLILIGLRKEFDGFVQNYNMHSLGKTINELHATLKLHEQTLPKNNAPALHAIRAGKVQKVNKHKKSQTQMAARGQNHRKVKHKQAYTPKPKIPPPPKKEDPAKDSICHECGEIGHWKRNCPQYLAELLKKKKNAALGAGGSGIFGLRASRKLKPGALSLYVGNGQREAVEAIGAFHLCFPSGLEIVLNNCHYAPSITRGVISVSRLYEDGFINRFVNNTIQVSRNNTVYFSAIPRDGIFEIDLSNSYTNESSIYAVSNKRAKLDLDYALLWHCRLGHISKKRIKKLQHDGLLDSSDLNAFEKCVSCMSGKMARKPYTHQVEMAKDLLRLIHTDVCSPFKIMLRQGASYFVTFTDDFGRYGYVYLLKHKHEVFETFKVFQKKVENQLGKTIRSLRLDRGGEIPKGLVSQNVEFLKNSILNQKASGSLEDLEIIQEEDTHPSIDTSLNHEEDDLEIDEPQSDIVPIRRSTRTRHAPDRMCLSIDAEEHELGDLGEPANCKAALLDTESEKWINVMNVEMQSMKNNDVWVLVGLPPNGKTIGSKWLFKKKTDIDGIVHTYKARLVAKGYTQTLGIDYEETFSPVTDIRAIRTLIAIATYYDLRFGKWMSKQPSSMDISMKRFTWSNLKKFGFTQNRDEPCVYLKASGSNITFLILYGDDILIMGNNILMLQSVKSYLGRCFAMKDLGKAAYIFRIKIYRDRSRRLIGLCQSSYIEKILKLYCMKNSKRESIPMQEKLKLSKSQGASTPAELKRMQNVPYASANPCDLHRTTVKNILKYIMNTKDMFLVYGGDLKRELRVSCHTDAGYLTDADDLKSQTGYVFILNCGVVDWKSAKQSIFDTSHAEAEYIAAFDASKEAVWVRKFISGLGVVPTIEEPISMYCDNTGAIAIANESGITKGARHFRAKVHYLHEVIECGDIKLEKVHTYDNLADPFTKALAFPKHSEHTRNIGMLPASSLM
nr:retrotransposon protein, putative, Ty1-copia subclass [Tanacetum cinerariifolium]